LAARITAELEQSYHPDSPSGLDEMLRLAGPMRDTAQPPARPGLGEAEVKAALLAYRRSGVVGLGASALARALVPQAGSLLARGEAAYTRMMGCLDALAALGAGEAAAILRAELERQLSPSARQRELARSKTAYYRLRRAAIQALVDLLALQSPTPNSYHPSPALKAH
jgi:hypothetical protein